MASSYLLSACRTPIGKFLGSLSTLPAPQLAATAIADVLVRSGIDAKDVDEVILGNVLPAGLGQAPARQAALAAGLPPTITAMTVNKVCGSGLEAVTLADRAIRSGDAQVVIAGGMENMSRAPHLLSGTRDGWKLGNREAFDSMIHDGLWCAFENQHMGNSAEYIAQKHNVTRDDQDACAVKSHHLAAAAQEAGKFTAEIVPVTLKSRRGDTVVESDEGPRGETDANSLAKLRASFSSEGTVTAGNASQLSDGAAALVVASEAVAAGCDSPIKMRIVASATSGVAPKDIFIAPVTAVEQVLAKAKMKLDDIDLFELNEAFAAQSVACLRGLHLEDDRVNVHGGAIALGHPIGASGARVLVTLLHALADRNLKRGLASLCLGGGNAVAMIVERV
ncbi:MAG: acetyl-CoA C-acetyltransferase [Pirellulales bacterium]|nr:acetyl-CoA C-acetyltransferase [Pirellulales bacterium]